MSRYGQLTYFLVLARFHSMHSSVHYLSSIVVPDHRPSSRSITVPIDHPLHVQPRSTVVRIQPVRFFYSSKGSKSSSRHTVNLNQPTSNCSISCHCARNIRSKYYLFPVPFPRSHKPSFCSSSYPFYWPLSTYYLYLTTLLITAKDSTTTPSPVSHTRRYIFEHIPPLPTVREIRCISEYLKYIFH